MTKDFKVKDGAFIPVPIDSFPSDPFQRRVHVEVEDSSKGRYRFDETYPYIDRSVSYRFNRKLNLLVRKILYCFVLRLKMGLKIEGKEKLKSYREQFSNGAISVANHIFFCEAVGVQRTLRPDDKVYTLVYAKHLNGKNGWALRYMGGLPVAETLGGSRKFSQAIETFLSEGNWIHVFPEEVRWDFYAPIRPFRKGAFSMAYKYGVPIIPCAYSFRKRTGFRRLLAGEDVPLLTLHIGDPVLPDTANDRVKEIDRLISVCHSKMEEMAGIEVNPWPASLKD